jgi:hypothetical protein
LGTELLPAIGKRARFGNGASDYSPWRAGATSIVEGFFACNRAEPPVGQGDGRFTNGAMMD